MSNLNAAKKKVWDLVLSKLPPNSYIFGGAVRDHVAGDVYNDIDIYFASRVGRIKFQQALNASGFSLVRQALDWQEYENEYGTPDLERYHLTVDGETIQLDLVTKGPGSEQNPFNSGLDLDVNGLGMRPNGEVFFAAHTSHSLEEVLEKVKKHQFMMADGCLNKRLAKVETLKARGWQAEFEIYDHSSHSLKEGDEVWINMYVDGECRNVKGKIIDIKANIYSEFLATVVDSMGKRHESVYLSSIVAKAVEPGPYVKTKTDTSEEGNNMTTPVQMSFIQLLAKDAKTGGFRSASKTIPKTARVALLAFMKSKKAPKGWIKTAKEMMETEWGLSLIQQILAWSFRYFPMLKDDPRAQALADEWGADSWAIMGNEIMNELMVVMAPVIAQVRNLQMPEDQVRVETRASEKDHSSSEEIEEAAEEEAARRVA